MCFQAFLSIFRIFRNFSADPFKGRILWNLFAQEDLNIHCTLLCCTWLILVHAKPGILSSGGCHFLIFPRDSQDVTSWYMQSVYGTLPGDTKTHLQSFQLCQLRWILLCIQPWPGQKCLFQRKLVSLANTFLCIVRDMGWTNPRLAEEGASK